MRWWLMGFLGAVAAPLAGCAEDDPAEPEAQTEPAQGTGEVELMCESFVGAEPEQVVMLSIRNETGVTVFNETRPCSTTPLFTIDEGDGPVVTQLDNCADLSCDLALAGVCGVDPCDCGGGLVEIGPGETVTVPWDGRRYDALTVDDACGEQGCSGVACLRPTAVTAGRHRLELSVTRCVENCDADGGLKFGDPQTYAMDFDYPVEAVELVLD